MKDFYCKRLRIKTATNDNPKKTDTEDCLIRALSTVTNIDYFEVYKQLYEISVKNGSVFNYFPNVYNFLKNNNIKHRKIHIKYRAKLSVSVGEFMVKHRKGKYLILLHGHAIAYVDGVYFDSTSNIIMAADEYITSRIIKAIKIYD